ncbi:hypothetical protein AB0M19_03470, partial [Streptomyces sp. NPDC051920]
MSDGRPTKAKWWGRPRPGTAGTDTAPAHLTDPDATGPDALRPTAGEAEHPGDTRAGGLGGEPGGFEPHLGVRERDTGGDYELERPARAAVPEQAGPPPVSAPAPRAAAPTSPEPAATPAAQARAQAEDAGGQDGDTGRAEDFGTTDEGRTVAETDPSAAP